MTDVRTTASPSGLEGTPGRPGGSAESPEGGAPPTAANTRISHAWTAVVIGVLLGIALIDFIVQNTRTVRIEFFSASGQIPLAVALLAAAVAGGLVVLIAGVARLAQLRLRFRRTRVQAPSAPVAR